MERTALLDTNILLLWLVADVDLSLLRNFKRVSQFTMQDAANLADLTQSFHYFVTTPHILTEASNFLDHAPAYRRTDLKMALAKFIEQSTEHYRPSVDLARFDEFLHLGLADCGIVDLLQGVVVITMDTHLAARVHARGGQAVNLNYLR
jgi:hypothetical protein